MNMWCDRTVSREPVRYTAATMEMMRLEDLHHIKCSVNYAQDHSHGHLANAVSTTYFAAKEWAKKDQAKAEQLEKQWEKDPKGQRQKLLRRAEKNLLPPYAWSGPEFFGHKETSCFAFVNRRGKHKAELTGIDVEGSHPILASLNPGKKRLIHDEYAARPKLPMQGSYSPRSQMRHAKRPSSVASTRPKSIQSSNFVRDLDIEKCAETVAEKIKALSRSASSSATSNSSAGKYKY